VTVTWTQTRTYTATVHHSDLADAVARPGAINDGHQMPEQVCQLEGDPFDHGDLNALLVGLEREADEYDVADLTVVSVRDNPWASSGEPRS
jgi:hypothetical protein